MTFLSRFTSSLGFGSGSSSRKSTSSSTGSYSSGYSSSSSKSSSYGSSSSSSRYGTSSSSSSYGTSKSSLGSGGGASLGSGYGYSGSYSRTDSTYGSSSVSRPVSRSASTGRTSSASRGVSSSSVAGGGASYMTSLSGYKPSAESSSLSRHKSALAGTSSYVPSSRLTKGKTMRDYGSDSLSGQTGYVSTTPSSFSRTSRPTSRLDSTSSTTSRLESRLSETRASSRIGTPMPERSSSSRLGSSTRSTSYDRSAGFSTSSIADKYTSNVSSYNSRSVTPSVERRSTLGTPVLERRSTFSSADRTNTYSSSSSSKSSSVGSYGVSTRSATPAVTRHSSFVTNNTVLSKPTLPSIPATPTRERKSYDFSCSKPSSTFITTPVLARKTSTSTPPVSFTPSVESTSRLAARRSATPTVPRTPTLSRTPSITEPEKPKETPSFTSRIFGSTLSLANNSLIRSDSKKKPTEQATKVEKDISVTESEKCYTYAPKMSCQEPGAKTISMTPAERQARRDAMMKDNTIPLLDQDGPSSNCVTHDGRNVGRYTIPPKNKYVPKAHLFREKHRETITSTSSGNDSGIDEPKEHDPKRRLTPQERLAKLEKQEREHHLPKGFTKEYSTREMDRMIRDWLRNFSGGAVNPSEFKCSLGEFEIAKDVKLRGMRADCHLNPGDVIMKIPILNGALGSFVVMPDESVSRFLNYCAVPEDTKYTFNEIYTIFLILHKRMGRKSPWFGYIESLPKDYDVPNTWEQQYIDNLFQRDREIIYAEIEEIWKAYSRIREGLSTSGLVQDLDFTNDFLWAFNTLKTRSFTCDFNDTRMHERQKFHKFMQYDVSWKHILCPYIDMVNHSTQFENADVEMDIKENWVLFATKHIKTGEQIFISYNDDPTFNFFHTYGFVDESAGPNPDEEIIFQSCEITNKPEKLQIIEEWYLPRDILCVSREDGATLELQKAAYVAVTTDEEYNSDQTTFFLNGEISKLKGFEQDLIDRVNKKITDMICDRRDALEDKLLLPDYQTNEMTRTLYRIQSEFLLELYKSKTEFWTVRTDIFEDVSDHWDDKDDEELDFMESYGMSSAIQFQTQRIIPAMSMETLYIDEEYVPDEGEDVQIRIVGS